MGKKKSDPIKYGHEMEMVVKKKVGAGGATEFFQLPSSYDS